MGNSNVLFYDQPLRPGLYGFIWEAAAGWPATAIRAYYVFVLIQFFGFVVIFVDKIIQGFSVVVSTVTFCSVNIRPVIPEGLDRGLPKSIFAFRFYTLSPM